MAFGRAKTQAPPSMARQLLPLIILVVLVAGLAWVGYQIYLSASKIGQKASEKMGTKNVVFTKEGIRVGVKSVKDETYVDTTQSWVVKVWNMRGDAQRDAAAEKRAKKQR